MQERAFILLSALFLVFNLFNAPYAIAQIGVKVGLGVSDIGFKNEGQIPYLGYEINSIEHRLPLLTYQIGAFANFEVSDKIGFQPELLYVTQGLDYSTNFLYDDVTYKIKSSYLQLPLLFKYRTAIKKKKQSGILVGPYAAIKLKGKRIIEMEGSREKTEVTNLKQTDLGIIAGYAFDFNLASKKMLLEIRTGYSLINMMDRIDGYIPSYYGPKKEYARNISITVSAQYEFTQIGRKKSIEQ
jgi:hypothetical protein